MSESHEGLNWNYFWVPSYRKEEVIYQVGPYEIRLRWWIAQPRVLHEGDIFTAINVCIIYRASGVLVDYVPALFEEERVVAPPVSVKQTLWQRLWGITPPQQLPLTPTPGLPLLEDAVVIARKKADTLAGISDALEKRIRESMQELKLREAAMREINIFLEEPADAPTELLLPQLPACQ